MIFSILVILLVIAISFFHYLQGLLSATISAILAALSAALAISLHEPLVALLLKGRFADQAHAMVLVVLFAGIYILLRVVFDKLVPGNVRFPALVDKVGGAVMGLVAAVFAVGTIALAAQMLPFGPTIGFYGRFQTVSQRDVKIPSAQGQRERDAGVYDEMRANSFQPTQRRSLMLPVDDMTVGLASHLSSGPLAGARPLRSVHPNLLDELFAARLGVQVGAKRTALNLADQRQVEVLGLWRIGRIARQIDAEIHESADRLRPPVSWESEPKEGQAFVVVRIRFDKEASDEDWKVRFSPGAARLSAGGRDYYPLGTFGPGGLLFANRVDDPLLVDLKDANAGADLLYLVDQDNLVAVEDPSDRAASAQKRVAAGAFLQVKRLATVNLSGRPLQVGYQYSPSNDRVMRKPMVLAKAGVTGTSTAGAGDGGKTPVPPPPAVTVPVQFVNKGPSAKLFTALATETTERNTEIVWTFGSASLKDGKFHSLQIEPGPAALDDVRKGANPVDELYAPPGQAILQVVLAPAGPDPWAWAAHLGKLQVIDSTGKAHRPHGAWARTRQGAKEKLLARYTAELPLESISPDKDAQPQNIWVAFPVPARSRITELRFEATKLADLNVTMP